MKKREKGHFSAYWKYLIIFLIILIIFSIFYFLFFSFKTGDLVYDERGIIGQIKGTDIFSGGYLVYWADDMYTTENIFSIKKIENLSDIDNLKNKTFKDKTEIYLPPSLKGENFSKMFYEKMLNEEIQDKEDIYEEILGLSYKKDCFPDIKCGSWGECSLDYSFISLINISELRGVQYKFCTDENKCIPDFIGSKECSLKTEIDLIETIWCEKNVLEIRDKKGKVLTRLSLNNQTDYLEIGFGGGYCFYCFDDTKNYDEKGIDCGGSCNPC